jgi:hypothetical protein
MRRPTVAAAALLLAGAAAVHRPAPAKTLQATAGAAGGIARGGLARGRCIGPALLRMRGGSSFAALEDEAGMTAEVSALQPPRQHVMGACQ